MTGEQSIQEIIKRGYHLTNSVDEARFRISQLGRCYVTIPDGILNFDTKHDMRAWLAGVPFESCKALRPNPRLVR